MWKSISPQQEICPSSLASRACLSHRSSPSTFSSAASTQDAPPNKWLISHRVRFSEVCPCALFSLMRNASSVCSLHPVSPVFRGAEPDREGDSKKRPLTHIHDANGYQATTSDRCFLQVSSVTSTLGGVSVVGHLVSHDTPES